MSRLPAAAPHPAPELAVYWEATRRDVLLVPRCRSCGERFWYPRGFCPLCHSQDLAWDEAAGGGVIYSVTVATRGPGPWAEVAPYVVAYVELDEGPRLLTNVVDCDPDSLAIGQRVSVVFDQAGDYKIPRFRPDDAPSGQENSGE
jgi:uncharacterized OB-fold protein